MIVALLSQVPLSRAAAQPRCAADGGVAAAATAAGDEPGEEIAGAAAIPEGAFPVAVAFDRLLPILDPLPQGIGNDPQLRDVGGDPGALGAEAGDPLAGLRILDVAQAVPDQPADVEFVVEDAGTALRSHHG